MTNQYKKEKGSLRIAAGRRGNPITVTVNGRQVTAFEGESVHAALCAAGIRILRTSKSGEPRGIFCGMGICYECLVTIDDVPDQRACMTEVRDRMKIVVQTETTP